MKPFAIIQSWGFWIIVLVGVLVTIMAPILGFVSGLREIAWVGFSSVLVLIIYTLVRLFPGVDKPTPFTKNWTE